MQLTADPRPLAWPPSPVSATLPSPSAPLRGPVIDSPALIAARHLNP